MVGFMLERVARINCRCNHRIFVAGNVSPAGVAEIENARDIRLPFGVGHMLPIGQDCRISSAEFTSR